MLKINVETYYPKRYLWYKLIGVVLALAFVLFLALYYNYDFIWHVFLILFFLGVFYALFLYWFYINTSFVFDESKITKRTGILNKRSTIVQFSKAQNVKLRSDIIMRLFNISVLELWTASQSQLNLAKEGSSNTGADISLFLDSPQAEKLRLFILDREDKNKA